jgi:hypothetical protein
VVREHVRLYHQRHVGVACTQLSCEIHAESAKGKRSRNGGRTSIRFRAERSLLLAGKRDELNVGMEFDAELLDSVGDCEQRDGAGTIVIATGRLQHVSPRRSQ